VLVAASPLLVVILYLALSPLLVAGMVARHLLETALMAALVAAVPRLVAAMELEAQATRQALVRLKEQMVLMV